MNLSKKYFPLVVYVCLHIIPTTAGQEIERDTVVNKYIANLADQNLLRLKSNDPKALFNRGMKYVNGTGSNQNFLQAVKWFKMAADQDHAGARHELGGMYRNGKGVIKDDTLSFQYFKSAAKQGHMDAQYELGWIYEEGQGETLQNRNKALKWYREADKNGHIDAHTRIQYILRRKAEIKEANHWNSMSDASSSSMNDIYHADLYIAQENVVGVVVNCEPSDNEIESKKISGLEEAKIALAKKRKEIQDKRKRTEAELKRDEESFVKIKLLDDQNNQAEKIEHKQIEIEQQETEVKAKIPEEIPDKNEKAGEYNTQAEKFATGYGTAKDSNKAAELYLKAANLGNANAQKNLGYFYQHGVGIKKDEIESFKWYFKAYINGNEDAKKAFPYACKVAAYKGYAEAQYQLFLLYKNGNNHLSWLTYKSYNQQALDLLTQAAKQGHEDALLALNTTGGAL